MSLNIKLIRVIPKWGFVISDECFFEVGTFRIFCRGIMWLYIAETWDKSIIFVREKLLCKKIGMRMECGVLSHKNKNKYGIDYVGDGQCHGDPLL